MESLATLGLLLAAIITTISTMLITYEEKLALAWEIICRFTYSNTVLIDITECSSTWCLWVKHKSYF